MSNIQASKAPAALPAAVPVAAVVSEPEAPAVATATSAVAEPVTAVVAKPLGAPRKRVAKATAKPAAAEAEAGHKAAAKPAAKGARPATARRLSEGMAQVGVQPVVKLAAKPTAKPTRSTKPARSTKPTKAPKAAAVVKPANQLNAKSVAATPPITAAAGKSVRSKEKLVRDSFTMPRADFALIHQLKERGLGFKRAIRKSELLRAGLQALAAMDDARLMALLDRLPALKAGRPRKAG